MFLTHRDTLVGMCPLCTQLELYFKFLCALVANNPWPTNSWRLWHFRIEGYIRQQMFSVCVIQSAFRLIPSHPSPVCFFLCSILYSFFPPILLSTLLPFGHYLCSFFLPFSFIFFHVLVLPFCFSSSSLLLSLSAFLSS